ncbi:T9SS C-terminal target domain-containing protein, partial [candidate division KSB1 bacterium]
MDGSTEPQTFNTTAGTGSDFSSSYIAIGCGATPQSGAHDVDFYAYKPGIHAPKGGYQGLVGHWKFDEGSGAVAMDASGMGNDGTIVGASWINGKVGSGALSFDGASTVVNVPHSPSLEISDQLTISAWCYLKSAEGDQNVLQKEYMAIGEVRNGGMANVLNIGGSWMIYNYRMDAAAFLGSWHHIAMTYDGTQVVNYLDGQVDTTYAQTGVVNATTADLGIGTNNPWQSAWFNGDIDDVRIYNIPLNAGEVEALYITKVAEKSTSIPATFELAQNYPNPFNPTTAIHYSLAKSGHVTLTVFDVLGREVERLVDTFESAGDYHITLDASHLQSGVYFYKLQVGSDYSSMKKMILMK